MLEQDKNPFIGIQGNLKDVPPELRQKVMNDVAMAKLILEMATLFTENYSSLVEGMLKTKSSKKQ